LKPRVLYWICTAVVGPIVTYAATVWWPGVKLKTREDKFSKLFVQRMTCLGITGAMQTTLIIAIEVMLELPHCTCSYKWRPKQDLQTVM
jgi:hypothetical protein